jgi:L-asparaginase
MPIRIIATGGTIDDLDHDCIEDMPEHHRSLIPDALEQACVTADVTVDVLMQKDSRIVTDDDRALIADACRECDDDRIIITHGTYSLEHTARYLGPLQIPKTIVIIGSMVPLNKEGSDALFNLGAAIAAVQLLPPGVYVTMQGNILNWDNVTKNRDVMRFEALR